MSAGLGQYLLEVVLAYAATALIIGGVVVASIIQARRVAKFGAKGPDEETP